MSLRIELTKRKNKYQIKKVLKNKEGHFLLKYVKYILFVSSKTTTMNSFSLITFPRNHEHVRKDTLQVVIISHLTKFKELHNNVTVPESTS